MLVFTFEEDIAFEAVAEVDGVGKVGLLASFVYAGGGAGNEAEVLRLRLVCVCERRICTFTSGCPFGSR